MRKHAKTRRWSGRQSKSGPTGGPAAKVDVTGTAFEAVRAAFVVYLREVLIPDLRESGRNGTAEDFETCIALMELAR